VGHTFKRYSKHFIALVRFLAAGYGNVGHLRLPDTNIHGELDSENETEDENAPDWMVLDNQEDEQ
jgi:hypothetical protein